MTVLERAVAKAAVLSRLTDEFLECVADRTTLFP